MPRRGGRWLMLALLALLFLASGLAYAQEGVIQDIRIHGNRRIPSETIRARIFTRPGDVYDQNALERDFNSLWNSGYFEDIRLEREQTQKGWLIHVYVKEKPTIREVKYEGLTSATQSEVLDKFKERKVQLTMESQYDPTKVKKAEVVLKELLASRGRQFATIRTEVRQIPPAAVSVTFVIKEGPKVKVGKIRFDGNKHLSSRQLRAAMKNLRPIGIPHSIFLENLFSKTFDSTKLDEDAERVRREYQVEGYFKAIVSDPKTKTRDVGGIHWWFPFKPYSGKSVDITMPVEEGERYRLKEITFSGNKAIPNSKALRSLFKMQDGDIFNVEFVRQGLEEMRKMYGAGGYINFSAVPDTQFDDEKKLISLKVDVDEGKQYYVRRIEFVGNTTTRDKVIRRELALEEGQIYNSKLWEYSLLRLNQLQYFEPLKVEQDSETKQDNKDATVDLTLKVKEKGKNQIGLTGGVSGLSGGFIGLNYATNNLLGKGETLSVGASVGQYERNIQFGFTEPYMFDRPLQLGFTVFSSKYNYDYVKQLEIATGQQFGNLSADVLNTLQNYSQSTTGFSLSASYPIRRSFKRVGLTYTYSTSSIQTFSTASQNYFNFLAFRNISGPNALQGIHESKLMPMFTFNSIDNPQMPHSGKSLTAAAEVSGIGGNVQMIRPLIEWKQFVPTYRKRNVIGYRVQASFVSGYGGNVAPPYQRFFTGGENDIRGFDIRNVSPVAFLTDFTTVPVTNPNGTAVPLDPNHPNIPLTVTVPIQRIVYPGGDTSITSNLEYRIPIVGPVTLAAFLDTGWNFVARSSQLRISQTQLDNLTSGTTYGCLPNPLYPVTASCTIDPGPGFANSAAYLLHHPNIPEFIPIIDKTNYQTRMSTGLELQVIMPIINAPVRIYYAYNPMRVNTTATTPLRITRDMFPQGDAGDYTFARIAQAYNPTYLLREPAKTFRFTVATTF